MEITNTQKILRYYLEYEIYNILNISQIKLDNETSFVVEKMQDIRKNLEKIKETKIKNEIKKIVGKRGVNQQELLNQINLKLIGLYSDESNKLKIVSEVENLIQGRLGNNINKNAIKNFSEEVCNIKNIQEFWLYAHNITYMSNGSIQRLPIFILKCILEDAEVKVLEVNINKESVNKILSAVLEKELSDVVIEYEEKLTNYESQIKGMIDGGDINHLIKIYYSIMKDTIGISENDIENALNGVTLHSQYIISLDELAEAGIKNIKEDIELINKLINNDNYIPNILNKYLSGSSCKKKDFNDQKYEKFYKGNYKNKFGINENQYRIVNTIKDNDLIAIEGPPGTGKTSLLKEIIANSIVERANLILENWDKELKVNKYFDTKYYEIEWFNNKIDVVKSIVVSSKNGEAIENVGKEINKEIRYMYPIARKYERLELDGKEYKKIIQQYKGMVCLPLGKQTNIKDFKDFLYYRYIPMLNKIQEKENLDEYFNTIKKRYKNKYVEIKKFEELIEKLKLIKNKEQYFYGVMSKEKEEIKKIEMIFFKQRAEYEKQIEKLKLNIKRLKQQKEEIERNLKVALNELNIVKKELRECQKRVIDGKNTIENLQDEKRNFESVKHNFITRILNSNYKKNKNLDFEERIYELNVTNEIEKARMTEFIRTENMINDKEKKVRTRKRTNRM